MYMALEKAEWRQQDHVEAEKAKKGDGISCCRKNQTH
jgi:hypothetical protein